MSSLWLANMPLTPSVNKSLDVALAKKINLKTGKQFTGGRFRSSWEMVNFKKAIDLYHARHRNEFHELNRIASEWIAQGFMLRVDVFVVFRSDRVFSVPGKKVLRLDANNRLKGQLDAVATCLGIDDKYFFGGDCEKVTCDPGEQECAMVRITPMRPRTATEVRIQMRAEAQQS